MLNPWIVGLLGVFYYVSVLLLSKFASRGSRESEYVKTSAPAWLVALGIVGDTTSGVTYLSVPGAVADRGYSYLSICLGYMLGYVLISFFLLPLFRKENLASVYAWIGSKLGAEAQKISSLLFVLSRLFGSGARLCLVATVLHRMMMKDLEWGPEISVFLVTAGVSIYTLRSGIKSLIVTDTFQSLVLVLGLVATTIFLYTQATKIPGGAILMRPLSPASGTDAWRDFAWSFFSGVLITLSMTGLDQNIMQKTFSASNLRSLQKNFLLLGVIVLIVNFIALVQGSLLAQVIGATNLPVDQRLLSYLLEQPLSILQALFLFGLFAATLNSADSVITTVTSSLKIDLLANTRFSLLQIHLVVSALLAFVALMIQRFASGATIDLVLKSAGWTYGPLLGFFLIAAFGWKHTKKTLRIALIFSVLGALAVHLNRPLGPEVILIVSMLLTAANFLLNLKPVRGYFA